MGCRFASVTSDLENAANSRAKEATDFPTGENELSEVTDSLAREMTTFARVEQATITLFQNHPYTWSTSFVVSAVLVRSTRLNEHIVSGAACSFKYTSSASQGGEW